MSDHRIRSLGKEVMAAAHRISEGLGWTGRQPAPPLASDGGSAGAGSQFLAPPPEARARWQAQVRAPTGAHRLTRATLLTVTGPNTPAGESVTPGPPGSHGSPLRSMGTTKVSRCAAGLP